MIKRVYLKIRNVLFNKRKIPSELSRWYFLLVISLLTLIAVLFFYRSMRSENVPLYRQVHLDVIESAHKGVGFIGMDFNIVPEGKGNEKQAYQSPINVDMGILPIPYDAIAEITNFFGPEKEVIVDTITLAVNRCGEEVSFVNEKYDIEKINGKNIIVKYHYITGSYCNTNSDTAFCAEWRLCNGIHTSKPQRIHVEACGDDLFYPQSKHPADINIFLVINGTYKLQDSLFHDTSHIVLNFDQASWTFDNIYPKPTSVSPSQVAYIGEEAVQRVFDNHGIYLQSKNESIRTKNQRLQYTYTIMISALLAFLFDILVRLVVLWRNGYLKSQKD